jgi:hypothetical protein
MTHLAKFEVTAEFIAVTLALPVGSEIKLIALSARRAGIFEFVVEHPDLPEVEFGGVIPQISPRIHADSSKQPDTWLTFDWNLESLHRE